MATTGTLFPNPPAAARDLIFISYSHRDRDWLEHLRIFLKPYTRQNLKVWADPYIEVGGHWRRDIAAALLHSCVGVLLLSPNFLASDFVYSEELPPLLEGADAGSIILVVVPVSASNYEATPLAKYQFAHPPDRPLDKLRRPDRNAAFVEITKKIVAAAKKAAPELAAAPAPAARSLEVAPVMATERFAALHGVPGQRPNYLRRQVYLDRAKEAVLGAADRAVGITAAPQGARVGLHGMGGIGKTVLAIDLVNDDEVRRAFSDGIFWLTLGQAVEPLQLQGELAGFIAGETKAFATAGEGREQLRRLLEGKSCLLVLDDLWRPQDAEPFDVLDPRSRLLVTTRDADLLTALGARELALDVLSEDLALELLTSWSGQTRESLPPAAAKVAESCGYLPLALALAGARVRAGARWEDVLSALELGQLEFLDHPYGSIFKSLRLGTDALTEFDRDRYFELAVFPEDTEVPIEAVCTLWRHTGAMERHSSEDLLLRLHRRALLTRSKDGKRISFHDLQHDFLRLNVPSLSAAHTALIDAYRAVAPSGWPSGPDDGYFFQHLPQHLAAADLLDELKALLCDCDWLSAKLRATNITAILADYDLVAGDRELTLIQQALRLSIPALVRDTAQLQAQLLGRLRGADIPAIKAFVAGAQDGPPQLWLCPRFASLTRPGGPLRQILVGHKSKVNAVAFFSDGRRALSGSDDNTLRFWDLATGELLGTFDHPSHVNAVAAFFDGKRALSGSEDGKLRLWDLTTGELLRAFEGHAGRIAAVPIFPDQRRALSGGWDGKLRLWDVETGELLSTLVGHTSNVTAIAIFDNGMRALSASWDHTLRLWDLGTVECLKVLRGHTNCVSAVSVAADVTRAVSGSWDHTVRVWDLSSGENLAVLETHNEWVLAVAMLADGSRALSAPHDDGVIVWDLQTGKVIRSLKKHANSINALAVIADGSRALSGSWDNTLRLWDLTASEDLSNVDQHGNAVTVVMPLPGGRHFLSGSLDNTLRVWNLSTGRTSLALRGHDGAVTAIALLADGLHALSASVDNSLRLWDLKTGESLRTFRGHTDEVTALAVGTDAIHAVSGCEDSSLRVWNLKTGQTLRILEGHTDAIQSVSVFANGKRALSASRDGTLRLWDLTTGETLRILGGHTSWITAQAILPDGHHALSGSLDKSLILWDLEAGVALRVFGAHASWVSALALLANSRCAVWGLGDGTLLLWNLETGEKLRDFRGHTNWVSDIVQITDNRLLSTSADHTLFMWDIPTGRFLAGFTADAAIRCIASVSRDLVVVGSQDGRIHVLEIREPGH